MLADEAGDAAPVPERAPRQEAAVGDGLVMVDHDRLRHVPALPAGLACSIGKVDVVAVEAVALVEAAELVRVARGAGRGTRPAATPTALAGSAARRGGSAGVAGARGGAGAGAACGARSCRAPSGSCGATAASGRPDSGAAGRRSQRADVLRRTHGGWRSSREWPRCPGWRRPRMARSLRQRRG